MSDEEEEEHEFEYSDQSEDDQEVGGVLVDAQNMYYEAKSKKGNIGSGESFELFNSVVKLENDNAEVPGLSDLAFKAIKQTTKLYILNGDFPNGLKNFR